MVSSKTDASLPVRCFMGGCNRTVTDDDYCRGSGRYICFMHNRRICWGRHEPHDHLDPDIPPEAA